MGTPSQAPAERRPEPLHELVVTQRRVEDDLDTDPELSIGELAASNPIIEKFRQLRSQNPTGQEIIQALTGVEVFSLHSGRYRGATWHDRDRHAVWLLAAGIHRSDSDNDVYNQFVKLHDKGRLLPTEYDYERLFEARSRRVLPDALFQVEALLEVAKTSLSHEHTVVLQDGTQVAIVVECDTELDDSEDWHRSAILHVGILLSKSGIPDLLPALIAGLAPHVTWESWEFSTHMPTRPAKAGELIWILA